LIATGAANIDEVKHAMSTLQKNCSDICLMQCNTNYEGVIESAHFQNLNVLSTFKELYPEVILGLSCHMPKWTSVLGSVAMGARVIEKHFTDDRNRKGPDHGFAINPEEWEKMVKETRLLESMLGDGVKRVESNEQQTVIVQQRCLRAKRDLKANEKITDDVIEALRPCPEDGIKPSRSEEIIGRGIVEPVSKGEHIKLENLI